MKKKKILFYTWQGVGWMGGVYYVKNMIFALLQTQEGNNFLDIFILTSRQLEEEFSYIEKYRNVTLLFTEDFNIFERCSIRIINALNHVNICKKTHAELDIIIKRYNIDLVYPMCEYEQKHNEISIDWIPDFQHVFLPQLFSEGELTARAKSYSVLAGTHNKLVLSSESAFNDYKQIYPEHVDNVYVIPFVSAIDENIINDDRITDIQNKYKLPNKYLMVANQYWAHKNHKVLFEALAIAKHRHNVDIYLVSTGLMKDYRNPVYIDELKDIISENEINDNIIQLGLISRYDQLMIMKGAIAVVQPSLFEGWGTVVEDAKTLHKRIIMSDIEVHKEQANDDCQIFERNNAEQLANMLTSIWKEDGEYRSKSNYDYIEQAKEYGSRFINVIFDK